MRVSLKAFYFAVPQFFDTALIVIQTHDMPNSRKPARRNTPSRIGKFSRLTQVSTRMLWYYDEANLLTPAEVGQWTGRRLYSVEQIPPLNRNNNTPVLDIRPDTPVLTGWRLTVGPRGAVNWTDRKAPNNQAVLIGNRFLILNGLSLKNKRQCQTAAYRAVVSHSGM